jgi:hypothetical protein
MYLFTKKLLFFMFILMGIMGLSALYVTVCPLLCVGNSHDIDSSQHPDCTFSSHSFVQTGMGLFALFILLLLGFSLLGNTSLIAEGFFLPPFKPPQIYV